MKVSIILPVYNGEKYIERAIKSVLAQKYNNYELLILDGASTDSTMEIVSRYKEHIDVIISKPDHGYADAMNKGIKKASGDYIFMLAADDYLLPEALVQFANTIKACTDVWSGSVIHKKPYGYELIRSENDLEKLHFYCSIRHPGSFFRKIAYEKFGMYNTTFTCAADRELFLRFYTKGANFQIEDYPIVLFHIGGLSSDNPAKYVYPEDEKISVMYGMPENLAHQYYLEKIEKLWQITRKEKVKILLFRLGILRCLYRLKGQNDVCLSVKEVTTLGVPMDLAKEPF